MPRENRKRGKKHKKAEDEVHSAPVKEQREEEAPAPEPGPSWIKRRVDTEEQPQQNLDTPFGELEQDLKAYFRTVDVQMKQWLEEGYETLEADEDRDPNEERQMFFLAALQEMGGKERQLATDAECSTILERMLYSMDDFVRRVFFDALSGSHVLLARHRFASHVVQTLLTVAQDTVGRESKGIFPPVPESTDAGELRTMTQLVTDYCKELRSSLNELFLDAFASHVVRALLQLLVPSLASATPGSTTDSTRSRKSAKWKARQGPMKSVFQEASASETAVAAQRPVPAEFNALARALVLTVREELGENEVRALAADKVASPVLQLLLEAEGYLGLADVPGSLMDRVLVGMVTLAHESPGEAPPPSDYLGTLLRDPTASHLLETLVARAPPAVFSLLFRGYLAGRLVRLAGHPVANFVVARAIVRADGEVFVGVVEELEGEFAKLVAASRVGVVRAIVDRAAALSVQEVKIVQAIYTAFDLDPDVGGDKALLVPCVLQLKPKQDATWDMTASKAGQTPSFSIPGSLLLQSLLTLRAPFNNCVIASLLALGVEQLLVLCHDATASRVIDALFTCTSVPKAARRKFALALQGHYERLVCDRIGSRVGERVWAGAEPYLREKLARALLPHEAALAGDAFGKFFARRLKLHVLRRRPDEWREIQAAPPATEPTSVPAPAAAPAPPTREGGSERKPKRKVDAIDALFDGAGLGGGGKKKRGVLKADVGALTTQDEVGADLGSVLGAIKSAPKWDKPAKKKKRKE